MTSFEEIQSEFRRLAAECYGNQADLLKMHAASIANANAKANQYQYRPSKSEGNKTAKSYNLMRLMTGGQPITSWDDDVQGPTQGLRYYSGSTEDKAAAEKRRKSYELMKLLTGGR